MLLTESARSMSARMDISMCSAISGTWSGWFLPTDLPTQRQFATRAFVTFGWPLRCSPLLSDGELFDLDYHFKTVDRVFGM